ncbi:MAG: sigma-70 family RNA polymerase sigma factor [Polyangiaceae bacterium]
MSAPELVEHFFRHEYGRLVATLSRRVGVQHLEAVEDAVQSALMAAVETWTRAAVPDKPVAWLFRVASNALQDELRFGARRGRILADHAAAELTNAQECATRQGEEPLFEAEVQDDLLRMLFVCCDDAVPRDAQLVLALKTLCGFEVREIAHRLFLTEAAVYKRLERTRTRLRSRAPEMCELDPAQCAPRLGAVQQILYLLFTEGYLSSHAELSIRRELCDEAIRLTRLLAEHAVGQTPETFALLALMNLNAARLGARSDEASGLLLLDEQDRELWDPQQIQEGLTWLARSAQGDVFSRYHAEAGIAAEHCLASSLEATRWDRIVDCYEILQRSSPSPLHQLGHAVALAEWKGPAAGLELLQGLAPPTWLAGSYMWSAVLADLHRRQGQTELAELHADNALEAAPTPAIRTLLARRLGLSET